MLSRIDTVKYANLLARNDLALRYASSALGPFWITGQMFIFVLGLGFVFSGVFDTPTEDFLPFLAISITFWTFFSACVTESTMAILDGNAFIKDRGVRPETFVLKVFIRNIYMLAHNIVVPLLIFSVFNKFSLTSLFMAIPGFILFIVVAGLLMGPIALFASRFRDFRPIIESVTQLSFLITPIMWRPSTLVDRTYIVDYNPLAILLSLWREPMLEGQMADFRAWSIGIVILLVAMLLNHLTSRFYSKCVFWI